jgi:uncharacterized membrane protein YbaN (DUF454 family)
VYKRGRIVGKGLIRRAARSRQKLTRIPGAPKIEIDSEANLVRVCDPRLINPGERAFCKRLLETVVLRDGVSKADVDLGSATCRVQFSGSSFGAQGMADLFADCVREATSGGVVDTIRTDESRDTAAWTNLTAYPLSHEVSLWETLDAKPGQIEVCHRRPVGSTAPMPEIARAISRLDEVATCHASPHSHRLTVNFRSKTKEFNGFMDRAEQRVEELLAAGQDQRGFKDSAAFVGHEDTVVVARGPKRIMYLALAGGSFVMTLVGLVVPGVPTVPFLLATSYFLARSSRRLHDWLAHSAFFGPILTEWDTQGGLSALSKLKLVGLGGAIVLASILLAPLSPVGVVLVLVVGSLGTLGVLRLPGLPNRARVEDPASRKPRLALPAY